MVTIDPQVSAVTGDSSRCLRVVVAGTGFGRVYLDAVAQDPAFTLSGILARGSIYSADCAKRWRVPLYTRAVQIPDDTDIVCVVLRSGATGGNGSDIAQNLLARGIHVLQEHPVHAAEIADNLRAARQGNAAYAVNTLYPNLRPVRQFLSAAAWLRQRQRPRFIDAACNSQVAYPLLDIIGNAAGSLRPWSFQALDVQTAHPFRSLSASIAGIPVTLRVQNQVDPQDPDNHGLLMHRMEMGFDAGVLSLADTHGPVLWNARLHAPRENNGRLRMAGNGTERLAVSTVTRLDDVPISSYHDVFARLWPDAVVAALHALRADIADPKRRIRSGLWAQSVSLAWRDLTAQLGMPTLIQPDAPESLNPQDLVHAARTVLL